MMQRLSIRSSSFNTKVSRPATIRFYPHFRVTVWRNDLVPTLHVTFQNYHTTRAINRNVGGDIHIKQHDMDGLP